MILEGSFSAVSKSAGTIRITALFAAQGWQVSAAGASAAAVHPAGRGYASSPPLLVRGDLS